MVLGAGCGVFFFVFGGGFCVGGVSGKAGLVFRVKERVFWFWLCWSMTCPRVILAIRAESRRSFVLYSWVEFVLVLLMTARASVSLPATVMVRSRCLKGLCVGWIWPEAWED